MKSKRKWGCYLKFTNDVPHEIAIKIFKQQLNSQVAKLRAVRLMNATIRKGQTGDEFMQEVFTILYQAFMFKKPRFIR